MANQFDPLVQINSLLSDKSPVDTVYFWAFSPCIWAIILPVSYMIYTRYLTGLSHIPGPFIASISNFWKIRAAWRETMPQENIALHRKYGPLVRIGPNMISVDDPSAISTIYGFKPIWRKVRNLYTFRRVEKGHYLETNRLYGCADGVLSHSRSSLQRQNAS